MEENVPACPRCHGPTESGAIIGDRYALKWLPAERSLTLGIWAIGGETIGSGGFPRMSRPRVPGYRCPTCRIMFFEY